MMEMRLRRGVAAADIGDRWDVLALHELLMQCDKPEYPALVERWRWLVQKGLMPPELFLWRVALDCGFDLDNRAEENALMLENLRACGCAAIAESWIKDRAQFDTVLSAGREYWPQDLARWN